MKLFILTHCAAEENYTPIVYKTLEEAQAEIQCIYDDNNEDEDCADLIYSSELFDRRLELIYNDDTYDSYEIFEVEVNL